MRVARRSLLFALVLLVAALPLAAQGPPPVLDTVRVRPTLDTVTGIVFDSLAGEPLEGAFVIAAPSGVSAVTDATGRFVLYSDTVATRLTAYHPALDQIGLGALVVDRPAGRRRAITLATPSLLTLWPQLCDGPRPLGGRSGIVTGTARLADGSTRLAGASVIAQWPRPDYAVGGPDPRSREVRTDSLGNFLICGVEEFVDVSLAAISREYESGVITLPPDARSVRRIDLVLGAEAATGRLRGIVRNREGAPLANIQVALDGAEEPVITGEDGRFGFERVPLGSRMLWVRAIGYQAVGQSVEVMAGDSPVVEIPFDRVVELAGVTVSARTSVRLERREFELRRKAGFARVVDSLMIARAPNVRAAIQMTPGVRVQPNGGRATTEFEIRGRNGCRAYLYLDGTPADNDLVNRVPPDAIAAIEFFPFLTFAPARYQPLGDECAVVLFWTKYGLRP